MMGRHSMQLDDECEGMPAVMSETMAPSLSLL
eukprot:CAMPEP_0169327228 /NCGR_PEP_ID=MMETSP1017-20121227/11934_1 /TAXON_ID=342587 /ORGANISM="Karlodinium micrum, Strain CCMP2283" /LENGTH=31 /DNA_ID= /DNA_START= /DNA_END= /DNA_ORIENTATION=